MNTVIQPRRVGSAHVRELGQVLGRGENQSRTALIDIRAGSAWTLGKGTGKSATLDNRLLAPFGCLIFAPHNVSTAKRDSLRTQISQMGGIGMAAILMPDCDLFVALLPSTSRVISLVIRHDHSGTHAYDSVVRGRTIRAKLDPSSRANIASQVKQQTTRSYSVWHTLMNNLSALFSRSGPDGRPSAGILSASLGSDEQVLTGDLFDLKKGTHVDHYRAPNARVSEIDAPGAIAAFRNLFDGEPDIPALLKPLGFGGAEYGKVHIHVGDLDFYWLAVPYFPALHLPFDPDLVLLLYKEPRPVPTLDWLTLDRAGLNMLRLRIGNLLEGGMHTAIDPFPETQREFQAILDELGELPPDDLLNRLDIGGFLPRPREIAGVMQRCQECIYYLPHRQWCDLPELPVPVKPEWWCRLWKV